jgi:sugar/nucleoside kinase (ribokinase family)
VNSSTSPLDLLTFGEALVEVMRTGVGQPLDQPGSFTGPYPSGAPFIFAAQAARLGARVGCVGCVGDDHFGLCMLNQVVDDGIDPRGLHVMPGYTTGIAFISYNADGGRDFVFHAKQAAAALLAPELLTPDLFEGLRCLHITGSALSISAGGMQTGLRALEMAREAGARISFDPNIRPQLMPVEQARTAFQPFIEAADVLLPTADELMLFTGRDSLESAVSAMRQRRPHLLIVITAGKDGCTLYAPDGSVSHVPAYTVTEVDPTGAGDCFDAGFLTRWLAGDSPAEAARFGNACGALAVTAMGPMAGARKRAEVEAFIQQHS